MPDRTSNSISLVALVILAFLLFNLFNDRTTASATPVDPTLAATAPAEEAQPTPTPPDPLAIRAPYDDYTLTQGPHGQSYGHYAIDLAAGKGATVLSPINGSVSAHYIDEYGNTTLIIENDIWQVLMLHGNYSVEVGQAVSIGQPVGQESNNGYTVDWRGQSCRGRDCGYHTHLNIYDKRIGSNVDPLELIAP